MLIFPNYLPIGSKIQFSQFYITFLLNYTSIKNIEKIYQGSTKTEKCKTSEIKNW